MTASATTSGFPAKNETLYFEVKSTITDEYESDIGESELRAARAARKVGIESSSFGRCSCRKSAGSWSFPTCSNRML